MSVSSRMSTMRSTGQTQQPGQSPALIARINEKKAELENLKQLKDLSDDLAEKMQTLEDKLSTLSNGTEVLSNWHNVLQAINLASSEFSLQPESKDAKQVKAKVASTANTTASGDPESEAPPLPETLVRIPAQQQHHRQLG